MKLKEEEKLLIIRELSESLKIPEELWYSLYVYFGDDLFFLIEVLAGRTVRFPKVNVCKTFLNKLYKTKDNVEVHNVNGFVRANGKIISSLLLKKGDVLELGPVNYEVLTDPYHVVEKNLLVLKEIQEEVYER